MKLSHPSFKVSRVLTGTSLHQHDLLSHKSVSSPTPLLGGLADKDMFGLVDVTSPI